MTTTFLGEFQEFVFLSVSQLDDEIRANLATMHCIQDKGFVRTYLSGATDEKGGRLKRFFTVTSGEVGLCI